MKPSHAFIFSATLLLLSSSMYAQYPGWQQKADYNMEITVDTELHQYDGKMNVLYENNSPDDLNKVFLYAFFNAFQPGSMMDVRSRNISDPDSRVGSRISELPEEEWGWIKEVIITMDGEPCIVSIEETILDVVLPTPIVSGTKANFQMSWKAQVPRQIRRSGWMNKEGIELSMTQWYPKFCEYDHEGWHSHPYVGREFHGVWGNYDVKIHLPEGYNVAATGISKKTPEQSKSTGNWHFRASNVIDFVIPLIVKSAVILCFLELTFSTLVITNPAVL